MAELNTQPNYTNGIRSWPVSERPRERLIAQGPGGLSDSELLAILLRNGTRDKDAIAFARQLISEYGGLRGLFSAGYPELKKIKGLGAAKIASIFSAMELAKRGLREELAGKDVVRDPQSVVDYLSADLRDRKKEIFKVLFLDRGNRIVAERDLFQGTVDQAMVHPREIVKAALELHASGVVLVHNHPSGRTEPSREDQEMTRKVQAALQTVSIRVLDHIIIGDNRHFSFREHNWIHEPLA